MWQDIYRVSSTKRDAHFATDGCWGISSTEAVLLQHFEGVQDADYG